VIGFNYLRKQKAQNKGYPAAASAAAAIIIIIIIIIIQGIS
jgi:hypothetical protein